MPEMLMAGGWHPVAFDDRRGRLDCFNDRPLNSCLEMQIQARNQISERTETRS
jgi:hypothetical protein